ncbi:MAG TPA: alpha/beta hydrolase [Streptosporangiaceae bacterium]
MRGSHGVQGHGVHSHEVQRIVANDLTFGYLSAGPAGGPLALCLHGFPDSAHTWRHLLPALAAQGFRAVAPFMRGYAPTAIPADGAYQTGALAADANALHEALGGREDAVLIGHDWGAAAAYGAVVSAPGRWRRSVVMAVPPLAAMLAGFLSYAQLKRSFYIFLFQTSLADAALTRTFVEGLWRDWSPGYDAAEDVAHAMDCLATPDHAAAAIGYYRAMLDPSRHLARYAAGQDAASIPDGPPHLYLHGSRDGCLGVELARDAGRHLPPGSRVEIVEDTGHFLHLQRPAEVAARILEWVMPRPGGV